MQKLRRIMPLALCLAGCAGEIEPHGPGTAPIVPSGEAGQSAHDTAGAAGAMGGSAGAPPPTSACPSGRATAGPGRLARLTPVQYRNTVAVAFDGRLGRTRTSATYPKGIENPLQEWPTPHFSTETGGHSLNEFEVRQALLQTAALGTALVDKIKTTSGSCLATGTKVTFDVCADTLLRQKGELLFRRPLTDDEATRYATAVRANAAALGPTVALAVAFQALLMAPQTLFVAELAGPDGQLEAFALAAALSYRLTDYPPDEELWTAAKTGALVTNEQIAAQVVRLVGALDQRATARRFVEELFEYEGVLDAFKTAPGYDRDALFAETTASVTDLLRSDGHKDFFRALLTSPVGYVSDTTAPLYGQPPPAKGQTVKVTFAPDQRAGLLTQPAFLANFADMDLTKPVRRGAFISERILCRPVPAVPIGVVPALPPATAHTRMRDLLALHTTQPSCKACHQLMDPMGLALELYDEVGRRRTTAVDTSGVLTDSGDQDGPFRDGLELVQRLAQSEAVERCFVRQSFAYWLGREPTDADACALEQARGAYARAGGDFVALVQALLTSPAFLDRAQP